MKRRTGYDLGGADFPYDPENLTVVDILTPLPEFVADYVIRDLNSPSWNFQLDPRKRVYIGRVLRYLDKNRFKALAAEIDQIVESGGTVTMFDMMSVIEPIMTELLTMPHYFGTPSVDLINPPADDESFAEYQVIIEKN